MPKWLLQKLCILAVFSAAGLPTIGSAQTPVPAIDISAAGRAVIMHQDITLTPHETEILTRFKDGATFYAAVAIDLPSRGQKGYGVTKGYNDLKTAQDHAMRHCRSFAPDKGKGCVLLASIVPGKTGKPGRVTLSRSGTEGYVKLMTDVKRTGNAGAFAASAYFSWAASVRKTPAEAEAAALQLCQQSAARDNKAGGKQWARAGIAATGNQCRVISVFPAAK